MDFFCRFQQEKHFYDNASYFLYLHADSIITESVIKIENIMKKITNLFILASVLFAAGCGGGTKLIGSWTEKEQKSIHLEKIGIAALTPNTSDDI